MLNYSYRDYGNRAGFQRMMEAMDRCGVRGSVSLNVAVCDHYPEIVAAESRVKVNSPGQYLQDLKYGNANLSPEQASLSGLDKLK